MSTSEIPEGVTIEDIYVIEAAYTPEAAERRGPVRGVHLARIAQLQAAGTVIAAGAYKDLSASLLLVRADSEDAAVAIAREDVYVEAGVWGQIRARPFGLVSA